MRSPRRQRTRLCKVPSGRTHAATVTSLLGTPGFEPPGLMEMRMRHAAAFAGEPARLFDIHPAVSAVSARQDAYIRARDFDRPTVVFDLEMLRAKYRALEAGLGDATIHYAVKANPAPEVVAAVAALGGRFDCASRGEIDLCLGLGVPASHIAFGNTIKRAADIAHAHAVGVEQFAADAEEELVQDRRARPGRAGDRPHAGRGIRGRLAAQPQVRLLAPRGAAADGPRALPRARRRRHLVPRRQPDARAARCGRCALDAAHALWTEAAEAGHALRILNIGGGFPAFYGQPLPATEDYAAEVMRMVRHRFGTEVQVMAEPGRGLVAEAGVIVAEVVLVARKDQDDLARWVFLDIGKFSGLAETMDEAIRYQFETRHGDAEPGPASWPARPATRPTCSTRSGRCSCRWRSRPATRCASSAPAPIRRATRRSASTASRRSTRCSSAELGRDLRAAEVPSLQARFTTRRTGSARPRRSARR